MWNTMEYLNSSEYLYKKPLSIIAISLYDMNAILKHFCSRWEPHDSWCYLGMLFEEEFEDTKGVITETLVEQIDPNKH
jgi:hypothetical protein